MATGHTITISPAGRHIEISLDGVKLAESDQAVRLRGDRPTGPLLPAAARTCAPSTCGPTETRTTCPFKGEASYWSVDLDGEVYPDLVWSYDDPIPAAADIAGLLCFYAEHVDQQVS